MIFFSPVFDINKNSHGIPSQGAGGRVETERERGREDIHFHLIPPPKEIQVHSLLCSVT